MDVHRIDGSILPQPESDAVQGQLQPLSQLSQATVANIAREAPGTGPAVPADVAVASTARLGEVQLQGRLARIHITEQVAGGPGRITDSGAPLEQKPWSPPEMYGCFTSNKDGGFDFQLLDAAGKPIPTPPGTKFDPSAFPLPEITDPWGNKVTPFYPPPGQAPAEWPPGSGKPFQPHELYGCFTSNKDGGFDFQLLDAAGKPIPTPPGTKFDPSAFPLPEITDPWGNKVTPFYPPPGQAPAEWPPGSGKPFQPHELYGCFTSNKDGGFDFQLLDAAGKPVPTPPGTKIDPSAFPLPEITDPWGNKVTPFYPPPGQAPAEWPPGSGKPFQPPELYGCFTSNKDGGFDFQLLDAAGKPVPTPPGTKIDPSAAPLPEITDPWGNKVTPFYPPPGKPPKVWPP